MSDSFLHYTLGIGGLFVGAFIRHFAEVLLDKIILETLIG